MAALLSPHVSLGPSSSQQTRESATLLGLPEKVRLRIYHYLVPLPRNIMLVDHAKPDVLPSTSPAEREVRKFTRKQRDQVEFGQFGYTYLGLKTPFDPEYPKDMFTRTALALVNMCSTTRREFGPLFYPTLIFDFESLQVGRVWNWTLTPIMKGLVWQVVLKVGDLTQYFCPTGLFRSIHGLTNLKAVHLVHEGTDRQFLDELARKPEIMRTVSMIMKQCGFQDVYGQTGYRVRGSKSSCDLRLGSFYHRFRGYDDTYGRVNFVQDAANNFVLNETDPEMLQINNSLRLMLANESAVETGPLLPPFEPPFDPPTGVFKSLYYLPTEQLLRIFFYLSPEQRTVMMRHGSPVSRIALLKKASRASSDIETEEMRVRRARTRVRQYTRNTYRKFDRYVDVHDWIWPKMEIRSDSCGQLWEFNNGKRARIIDCMALMATCRRLRQELLPELYGKLEFNFAMEEPQLGNVWNWTLTPEAKWNVRAISLNMAHQEGLKIDTDTILGTLRGMGTLREVKFTGVYETVFTHGRNTDPNDGSFKQHGLIKCVAVLDECISLTRCLLSVHPWSRHKSTLRLVADYVDAEDNEYEVDLREEYANWKKRLKALRNKESTKVEVSNERRLAPEDPGRQQPSARGERAQKRRRLIEA